MQTNKSLKLMRIILAVLTIAIMVFTATACGKKGDGSSESVAGVYYYDGEGSEFTVTLDDEFGFEYFIRGNTESGKFEMEGNTLTLKVSRKEKYVATYSNGTLNLSFDGAQMLFLTKVDYTVTFDTAGGTNMAPVSVRNGKTVAKPVDPSRNDGKDLFVGWFADANYNTPFDFSNTVITANTTVYAKFEEAVVGQAEFTVSFDANYDGATNPESMKTTAGKLYDVKGLTRSGYEFGGWWFSMYSDANMLSYRYTNDMVFTEDTTLYALWTSASTNNKLDAPVVNVGSTYVTWDSVSNASMYNVVVTGPTGFMGISKNEPTTSVSIDFANQPAGDYVITVIAMDYVGGKNNSEATVRYYKNKSLNKVSKFYVAEPGSFVFGAVDNAEKYYITVDCGNDEHTHDMFDNGNSTTFNFSNCEMTEGGIKFTVIASANGYASSVSETYVYNKVVDSVTNVSYDSSTETLKWDAVAGASNYVVTVTCGDSTYTYETGTANYVCIKNVAKGNVSASIVATTKGYNPSVATKFDFSKATIATPTNVTLTGHVLSWDVVANANGYEVKIGDEVYDVETNSFNLAQFNNWINENSYTITVRANGNKTSLWSDAFDAYYYAMSNTLTYANNTFTWKYSFPAEFYEVQVNDGEPVQVVGANSATVTLTKAGENVLAVRYYDGNNYSDWAKLSVYAHTLSFDSRSGSAVNNVYVAVGDMMYLPEASRTGFEFGGWYNAPGGAGSNAMLFTDGKYNQAGDMMLFAYWKPMSYNVTFDYGTGVADGLPTSAKITVDSSFSFPVPAPSDANYAFIGWHTLGGDRLTDEQGQSINNWLYSTDTTVYATFYQVFKFVESEDKQTYYVEKGNGAGYVSTITIPETYKDKRVSTIGGYAFSGLPNLKKIIIPDTVTSIDISGTAFYNCNNLEEIEVYHVEGNNTYVYRSHEGALVYLNELESTVDMLFYPTNRSKSYRIPDDVTTIRKGVFDDARVTEIIVPTSVRKIASDAFINNRYLLKVTFEETAPEGAENVGFNSMPEANYTPSISNLVIEEGAFNNCSALSVINIPARADAIFHDPTSNLPAIFNNCVSLNYINVSDDHPVYSSVDGVMTNKAKNVIKYVPQGKTTFEVPNGITAIGDYAFSGSLLEEVSIPASLTDTEDNGATQFAIGNYAFASCRYLKSVVFEGNRLEPNTVTIGEYAFSSCSRLLTVTYNDYHNVKTIKNNAFMNCIKLTEIEIPAEITNVGNQAFYGCSSAKSVEIADGANEISFGSEVFANCTRLTIVDLPARVIALPAKAFDGCDKLQGINVSEDNQYLSSDGGVLYDKGKTTILFYSKVRTGAFTLPSTITTVGAGVFAENRSITSITFAANLALIGAEAFKDCINLTTVNFTAGGTNDLVIEAYAFSGCVSLANFSFPANVQNVAEGVLNGCVAVKNVTLPANTTSIGAYAFYSTQISSVSIPNGVETIGEYAFAGTPITAVNIPDATTTIGDYAFYNCEALSSLTFGDSVATIGKYAFANSKVGNVTLPATLTTVGEYAFAYNDAMTKVTFTDGNTNLVLGSEGTIVNKYFDKEQGMEVTEIIKTGDVSGYIFYKNTALTEVVFSKNITIVGTYTFADCTNLATVTVPTNSTLQALSAYAFANTAVTSFYFPKTLTNISYNSNEQTIGVGKYAFYNVSALTKVEFDLSASKSTFTIGESAFQGTSLTSVTIPSRLTSAQGYDPANTGIGPNAFADTNVTAINVDTTNNKGSFYSVDGMVYSTDKSGRVVLEVVPAGLNKVTIPANVEVIGSFALMNSKATAIEFAKAEKDVSLEIATGYTTSNGGVYSPFAGVSMDSLVLPARCDMLNSKSFAGTNIKEITLSENVRYIPGYCFQFANVEEVVFPDNSNLETVDDYGFYQSGIVRFNFPASLKSLGNSALHPGSSLNDLKEIVITFAEGTKLTNFGGSNFNNVIVEELKLPEGSYSLTSYHATKSPGEIDEEKTTSNTNAFTTGNYGRIGTLYIPYQISSLGASAFVDGNGNIRNIDSVVVMQYTDEEVAAGKVSKLAQKDDGVVYSADMKQIIRVPATLNVSTLEIPEGVTTICEGAFVNVSGIDTVKLPSTITSIRLGAFMRCSVKNVEFAPSASSLSFGNYVFRESGISSFTFPARTTSIGTGLFRDSQIPYVYFEEGFNAQFGTNMFQNAVGLKQITIPEHITSLGLSLFYGATSLEYVWFESDNKLTTLASYVFRDCTSLKEIDLPDSLVTLGQNDFLNCSSLKKLVLPAGVKELYNQGSNFSGCSSLESIEILGPITQIYTNDFKDCSSLKEFTLPDTVTKIGADAFNGCTSMIKFNISSTSQLTTIGERAFMNCTALKSIYIPGTVANNGTSLGIKNDTFNGCSSLTEVNFGAPAIGSEMSFGAYAFANTTALQEFNFPTNFVDMFVAEFISDKSHPDGGYEVITLKAAIGDYAFYNSGLKTLSLPSTAVHVGNYAFAECTALTEVSVANGVEVFGDFVFNGCESLNTINIPTSLYQMGGNPFSGTDLDALGFTFDGMSDYFVIEDGILYNGDMTELIWAFNVQGEYELPETVTKISAGAFKNNKTLTGITMHDAITEIGDSTFENTGLKRITIGKNVTSIGAYAFADCANLTDVTFEEGGTALLKIGSYAFANCKQLTEVTIPHRVRTNTSNLTDEQLKLGGYEAICSYAFYNCTNLTKVVFSEDGIVTGELNSYTASIAEYAFAGCTRLSEVVFASYVADYVFASKDRVETVSAIASNAFENTSITTFTFANKVKGAGTLTFARGSLKGVDTLTTDFDRPAYVAVTEESFM